MELYMFICMCVRILHTCVTVYTSMYIIWIYLGKDRWSRLASSKQEAILSVQKNDDDKVT